MGIPLARDSRNWAPRFSSAVQGSTVFGGSPGRAWSWAGSNPAHLRWQFRVILGLGKLKLEMMWAIPFSFKQENDTNRFISQEVSDVDGKLFLPIFLLWSVLLSTYLETKIKILLFSWWLQSFSDDSILLILSYIFSLVSSYVSSSLKIIPFNKYI